MPFGQFGEEVDEGLFALGLGEFPASEAVDLVTGQAKPGSSATISEYSWGEAV
ncbi:hypothetical protein [Streptomyces sp. NPDC058695]|uniref:hypothetical protein n=1 Tax=Streptomyces sp. NPDC058695 TaxID=3346604 RepID=UPI003659E135